MTEDIQHLIDRVKSEGVEEAEKEANKIIAKAKDQAAKLVKDGEQKAQDLLKKADTDAQAYTERSQTTLEQASRDLLITVGQGVENILNDIVQESLSKELNSSFLQGMLVKVIDAYIQQGGKESRIDLLVSEQDQKDLVDYFKSRYQDKMAEGVELRAGQGILKGFKVGYKGDTAYHDFTVEAIAEALSKFLRPHLAEIVHRVARGNQKD